ncbi:sugar ABC transporter permease [Muricomes intestini]|mgnify:FL=1|jgi:multiple sugar transport system permease protein|uniref:carbohydrate ABC transporter permease n=1 Tax=Muricomes intestini TaxID=1796634 RepID=UPI002FE1CE90
MKEIRKKHKRLSNETVGYFYVLPAVIFIALFVAYPIGYNIVISLQKYDISTFQSGVKDFVGLANYKSIFADDLFIKSVSNTFVYTIICIIFQLGIGFLLALFFNKKFPGANLTSGLTLIAWVMPMLVIGIIWKWLWASDSGAINYFLQNLHLISKPIQWLSEPKLAFAAVTITNIWVGIPFNMLLVLTGMTTIPDDVYEAARIDGAGKLQSLRYITLPLLKATMVSAVTIGFIYTFKAYDLIVGMTQGGPNHATEMISTLIYQENFTTFDFGKGSAMANVYFLIIFVVAIFYSQLVIKEEE